MKQYFETQRLIFRSWQEEDISHLARLNSDDKVMEYFLKKLSYQETIALYNQIQEEFTKMKKMLVSGIAIGLVIFGVSNSGWGIFIFGNMNYTNILFYIVFSMILTGISSFITFFCIGIYWSYSLLLRTSERKDR